MHIREQSKWIKPVDVNPDKAGLCESSFFLGDQ